LQRLGVAILCILNKKYYQKCHNRRAVLITNCQVSKYWPGAGPDDNNKRSYREKLQACQAVASSARNSRSATAICGIEFIFGIFFDENQNNPVSKHIPKT